MKIPKHALLAGLTFFLIVFPKINLVPVSGSLVSIRLEDVVILGMLLMLLVRFGQGKLKRFFALPTLRAWLTFIGWAGIITLISGLFNLSAVRLSLSMFHFGRMVEFVVIGLFFAVEASSREAVRAVAMAMVTAVVFQGLYALGQFWGIVPYFSTLTSIYPQEIINFQSIGVVIGTFGGHYDFGIFCAWAAASTLLLVPRSWKAWREQRVRLIWPVVLIIALTCLLGSGARSAYLALLVFLGLIGLLMRNRWFVFAALAGMVLVIGLFLSGAMSNFTSPVQVSNVELSVDFSLIQRLGKWVELIRSLGWQTIMGKGLSSFGEAVDGYYVRLIGETGLIGLMLFGTFLLRVARDFFRSFRTGFLNAPFAAIGLAGIVLLAVQGLFIDIFISSKIMFLLSMVLGTHWAQSHEKAGKSHLGA